MRAQSQIQRTVGAAEAVVGIAAIVQCWRLTDSFRVLKTGCGAERAAFRAALRLQWDIAIKTVFAWCLLVLTLLGREVPEVEAELLVTRQELAFLRDCAREPSLTAPENLGAAVRPVARFGGYRGRRHDHPAGCQTAWEGYGKLTAATIGHLVRSKWGGMRRVES